MFLFAFPILGYPKVLRSTLNRQPTLADFGSLPENQPGTDKLHLLTKKGRDNPYVVLCSLLYLDALGVSVRLFCVG